MAVFTGLGSNTAPSFTFSSDTNTGIYSPGADQVAISTGGIERLFVGASGGIGVGTNNPTANLQVQPSDSDSPAVAFSVRQNNAADTAQTTLDIEIDPVNAVSRILSNATSNPQLAFYTSNQEAFRVNTSGRLLVGTSSARSDFFNANTVAPVFQVQGTGNYRIASITAVDTSSQSGAGLILAKSRSTGNTIVQSGDYLGSISFQGSDGVELVEGAAIEAVVDGTPGSNDLPTRLVFSINPGSPATSPTERMTIGSAGDITTFSSTTGAVDALTSSAAGTTNALFRGYYGATSITSAATLSFRVYSNGNVENTNNSYGAISDIKLKENIVDANSQWSDIKALQVRNYNFKEGQTHTQIGLVAQEVELVSPGLVSESPDRDEEGNDLGTVTKSVNYSVLYMKAVKALQEAMERIETLEQRLNDAGIN